MYTPLHTGSFQSLLYSFFRFKLAFKQIVVIVLLAYLFFFSLGQPPSAFQLIYRINAGAIFFATIVSFIWHIQPEQEKLQLFRDIYLAIFWAITLALQLTFYVVGFYTIDHHSMLPTLKPGQTALVEKISMGLLVPLKTRQHEPFAQQRLGALSPLAKGDIVVFYAPRQNGSVLFVKRIVGLPGEQILLKSGQLTINEEKLYRPASPYRPRAGNHKIPYQVARRGATAVRAYKNGVNTAMKIPSDMYLVLGDNRAKSQDSRNWGFVPVEYIVGRLVVAI